MTTPDELLGVWINWAGDDAGLGAIWGFGIAFEEESQSYHLNWGTEVAKEEEEMPFLWKRISEHSILVGYPNEPEEEWEQLDYEIVDHIGGYEAEYFKLTEKGKQSFWMSPEPLHKRNDNPAQPPPKETSPQAEEPPKEYPSLLKRIQAAFIDVVILILFMWGISDYFASLENVSGNVRIGTYIFIFYLYEPLFVSLFGGTLGHRHMGVRVKRESNEKRNLNIFAALFRFFIKWLLGWLSFLTVSNDPKKRAIHDKAARSVVVFEGNNL